MYVCLQLCASVFVCVMACICGVHSSLSVCLSVLLSLIYIRVSDASFKSAAQVTLHDLVYLALVYSIITIYHARCNYYTHMYINQDKVNSNII